MPAALDRLDAARDYRILMDLRDGPARNDQAFEDIIDQYRKLSWGRFAKRAILVKTAAGALQIRRLEATHLSKTVAVFVDEGEALAFLRTP